MLADKELPDLQAVLQLSAEANLMLGIMIEAADLASLDLMPPIRDRFKATSGRIERALNVLKNDELAKLFEAFMTFGKRSGNVFELREQDLRAGDAAAKIVAENRLVAKLFADQVAELEKHSEADAAVAVNDSRETIVRSRTVLIIIALVSLLIAFAIGWFYVARGLVRRLTGVQQSMALIASGNLDTEIDARSSDEVAAMAAALQVFKSNRLEATKLRAERSEAEGESRWTAYGRPSQPLALSWKRKVDDRRAELPVRLRARLTTLVGLTDEGCQASTAVRVEVVQGLAREITLALPAGLIVNHVDGATVGEWEIVDGMLRVRPLDPIAGDMSFVVQGDMRAPREGPIVVPLVRVPSAERETGGVAVDVVGAGEMSGREARGPEPADPSELVVRYTPQAVLIANVEEARYRALASEDGRLLVHARYAIRNNQRSFLKVSMPPGSTVWSAEVAGRPVRPGVAERDAVLLPLEKGRAGVEAPTFAVDLIYLTRIDAWSDRGRARVDLPALDLPVSRTGLELYYSPRFHVDPQPGAFRVESDPGVFAAALRQSSPDHLAPLKDAKAASGLDELVERYRRDSGGRTVVGALPVHVTFPVFGPSIFLASELTEEGRAPSVELTFKRASGRPIRTVP